MDLRRAAAGAGLRRADVDHRAVALPLNHLGIVLIAIGLLLIVTA
jgi:hypothetical protein